MMRFILFLYCAFLALYVANGGGRLVKMTLRQACVTGVKQFKLLGNVPEYIAGQQLQSGDPRQNDALKPWLCQMFSLSNAASNFGSVVLPQSSSGYVVEGIGAPITTRSSFVSTGVAGNTLVEQQHAALLAQQAQSQLGAGYSLSQLQALQQGLDTQVGPPAIMSGESVYSGVLQGVQAPAFGVTGMQVSSAPLATGAVSGIHVASAPIVTGPGILSAGPVATGPVPGIFSAGPVVAGAAPALLSSGQFAGVSHLGVQVGPTTAPFQLGAPLPPMPVSSVNPSSVPY